LKKVEISFVEHMDDVLKAALVLEKPEEIFKKVQEKDIYQKEGMPTPVPNNGIITH